jgi:hypothetical protein
MESIQRCEIIENYTEYGASAMTCPCCGELTYLDADKCHTEECVCLHCEDDFLIEG